MSEFVSKPHTIESDIKNNPKAQISKFGNNKFPNEPNTNAVFKNKAPCCNINLVLKYKNVV